MLKHCDLNAVVHDSTTGADKMLAWLDLFCFLQDFCVQELCFVCVCPQVQYGGLDACIYSGWNAANMLLNRFATQFGINT